MSTLLRVTNSLVIFALLSVIDPTPALAKMPNGEAAAPATSICANDLFSTGNCHEYCETLDCDSAEPLGDPKACKKSIKGYLKASGGVLPPCELNSCPCDLDVAKDFASLLAVAESEGDVELTDADLEATLNTYCQILGPDSITTFTTEAFEVVEPNNTPQRVRMYHWITSNPGACNVDGGGFDGLEDSTSPGGGWSYGPYPGIAKSTSLSTEQVESCSLALQKLCDDLL